MATIPESAEPESRQGVGDAQAAEPRSSAQDRDPSPAECLEAYRTDLMAIAARELGADLTAKFGASDLVQETFLIAGRDAEAYRGQSPEEWRGWLRSILRNLASNFRRHYRTVAGRRVDREEPIGLTALDVADTITSPSQRAIRHEHARVVAAAVDRLPEHYRQVLHWHHREGLTFEQIATRLEISSEAARKLWARALVRLRGMLGPAE